MSTDTNSIKQLPARYMQSEIYSGMARFPCDSAAFLSVIVVDWRRARCVCRLRDPVENTIHNLELLSDHLEAVAQAKTLEIVEQRQKIEAILHSILPK